jgi:hypothetical protein
MIFHRRSPVFFGLFFFLSFSFLVAQAQNPTPSLITSEPSAGPVVDIKNLNLPSPEEFQKLSPAEQKKIVEETTKQLGRGGQQQGGCFDYYRFQSVVFSLKSDRESYQPGDTVRFEGTIENKNAYPVFDGLVFVRITREGAQPTILGNDIVDEKVLIQKVVLPASGKVSESLSYTLPLNLTGGNYSASFFFSVGGSFNLAGLPFTNEVVGTNVGFTVDGPQKIAIRFDRSATKINDQTYKHIGNLPVFDEGKGVVISNTLFNESSLSQTVTIQYDWYRWDGLRESDRLTQSTESFVLKPKEKKVITYQTPPLTEPVYYLRTTATSGVTKSIVNVRLATNTSRLRINYAGVDVFPVNKNQEGTIFVCFHNTSSTSTQGFIKIKAYSDERLIAEVATSTVVSGAIEVLTKKIIGPLSNLIIKTEVSDVKGNVVDKYEYKYQCQDIPGASSCLLDPNSQKNNVYSAVTVTVVCLIAILGIMAVLRLVITKKRKKYV